MTKEKLTVAAVLSGNRNFEGRVNPLVRANYLASPPLVVAYALAGRVDMDLVNEPLGEDKDGKAVYLRDIWPTNQEVQAAVKKSVRREMFAKEYSQVFEGDAQWKAIKVPAGDRYQWDEASTYIKRAPYFDDLVNPATHVKDFSGVRALAVLGDSITTDHISPAGNIAKDSPAGHYLISLGVKPGDFNSYGARRGNHEVMVRGTLANIRLRNQMAPGTEGGWTTHVPSNEQMFIYDASVKYQKEGTAAADHRREGIRIGFLARLGGQGRSAAGRESRDRRELRAHSSLEPGGHGRAAARVRGRAEPRVARA